MKSTTISIIFIGTAVIGGAASLHRAEAPNQSNAEPCHNETAVIVDYVSFSLPERIKKSSFVFAGTITAISPTQWNQDSGEYWEDLSLDKETRLIALPYYTLEVSNISSLYPASELVETTVVTVVGKSPAGCESPSNLPLKVGESVIIFGKKRELAWRNGRKSILGLTADPAESILIQRTDGRFYPSNSPSESPVTLESLRKKITEDLRRKPLRPH